MLRSYVRLSQPPKANERSRLKQRLVGIAVSENAADAVQLDAGDTFVRLLDRSAEFLVREDDAGRDARALENMLPAYLPGDAFNRVAVRPIHDGERSSASLTVFGVRWRIDGTGDRFQESPADLQGQGESAFTPPAIPG